MGIPVLPFSRLDNQVEKPKPEGYVLYPETIGEHIRNKRLDQKLLQRDLAVLFETSEDSITNWENNNSVPQIRFMPKIIAFLEYYPFEIKNTLGSRIQKYRYEYGLSHKKFGKLVGVDGGTVSRWENEECLPRKFIKLEEIIKETTPGEF